MKWEGPGGNCSVEKYLHCHLTLAYVFTNTFYHIQWSVIFGIFKRTCDAHTRCYIAVVTSRAAMLIWLPYAICPCHLPRGRAVWWQGAWQSVGTVPETSDWLHCCIHTIPSLPLVNRQWQEPLESQLRNTAGSMLPHQPLLFTAKQYGGFYTKVGADKGSAKLHASYLAAAKDHQELKM